MTVQQLLPLVPSTTVRDWRLDSYNPIRRHRVLPTPLAWRPRPRSGGRLAAPVPRRFAPVVGCVLDGSCTGSAGWEVRRHLAQAQIPARTGFEVGPFLTVWKRGHELHPPVRT